MSADLAAALLPAGSSEADHAVLSAGLADKGWRICNLYRITSKQAGSLLYRPTAIQRRIHAPDHHARRIFLKARQLGVTTALCLDALDDILFCRDNLSCGISAHSADDAEDFFRRIVLQAYDDLPRPVREAAPAIKRMGGTLQLDNRSRIKVGVSLRSGTYQRLHISEFGKTCARFPDKAAEVVSGSIPSVPQDGQIDIESTAEGRSGYFYEFSQAAQRLADSGRQPGPGEWQFLFFPWFQQTEYRSEASEPLPERLTQYFDSIEAKAGVVLDPQQRAWYAATEGVQGEMTRREYPSTPEEAFAAAIHGTYYATQMTRARQEGRIATVPVEEGRRVHTAWDLGVHDYMCVVFLQLVGREYRIVDYYENSGEGFGHYARVLQERGYNYGTHLAPHDIEQRELLGDGRTRRDQIAEEYGLRFEAVPRSKNIQEDIEEVRRFLAMCLFDSVRCSALVQHLDEYRKEWNDRMGIYSDRPRHDDHSHGADAFRTLAKGRFLLEGGSRTVPPPPPTGSGRRFL